MEKKNNLLGVREVMQELGLSRNDRAWRAIRKTLILQYGMARVGESGYRIPMKNLQKFIDDNFQTEC